MMHAEVKAKWVAALRSGEYEQGQSCLIMAVEGKKKYCCLGVLGILVGGVPLLRDGNAPETNMELEFGPRIWGHGHLPYQVLDQIGMTDNQMRSCCIWNDDDGLTFAQIADRVEAEF